jgi:hypothetical protein
MTATFNRPPIILSGASVPLPISSLDRSAVDPEVPSLVLAKVLENQLARRFSDISTETSLTDKLSFIEDWMSSLPSVFAVNDPDKRWDIECPRLTFQRLQLHCVGYMSQLVLLRSLVTAAPDCSPAPTAEGGTKETESTLLIPHVIDVSLKAMSVSEEFFRLCFPHQAKYFMVSFCPFDNAALLCSLLLHDTENARVPRRREVLQAIGKALRISRLLREYTKVGEAAWGILTALTSHLRLTPDEKKVIEDTEKGEEIGMGTLEGSSASGTTPHAAFQVESFPLGQLGAGFDGELSLPGTSSHTSEPMLEMDLGILAGVWDWQGLHLDSFGTYAE